MQNWINKNSKLILPLGPIVFIAMGALYVYFIVLDNPKPKVTDFDSCVEANDGIISTIYPPRCTYEGVTYFQDTELESDESTSAGVDDSGSGTNFLDNETILGEPVE